MQPKTNRFKPARTRKINPHPISFLAPKQASLSKPSHTTSQAQNLNPRRPRPRPPRKKSDHVYIIILSPQLPPKEGRTPTVPPSVFPFLKNPESEVGI
jgi:hypothetical protein